MGDNRSLAANFTGVLSEEDQDVDRDVLTETYSTEEIERTKQIPCEYVWKNLLINGVGHILYLNELYKICTGQRSLGFLTLMLVVAVLIQSGVNVGAHRLWAHRSFKARLPLRLWLLVTFTMAGQNSLYEWVRDHRVHHKFCETDADPHNIKRGFFFAHMGWLLCKKHPDVKTKGKVVDLSDLESDPLIMWHHKYYPFLAPIFVMVVPVWLLSSIMSWSDAFGMNILRYLTTLHLTWLINSYSHVYGTRPYDKTILATDSVLYSTISFGESWHNYHHVFPWDYKSSEWHFYGGNFGAAFIDLMAWLGLASDLKTVDHEMIRKRAVRTGDGSHPLWGWGDKDISENYKKATVTLHKQQ